MRKEGADIPGWTAGWRSMGFTQETRLGHRTRNLPPASGSSGLQRGLSRSDHFNLAFLRLHHWKWPPLWCMFQGQGGFPLPAPTL